MFARTLLGHRDFRGHRVFPLQTGLPGFNKRARADSSLSIRLSESSGPPSFLYTLSFSSNRKRPHNRYQTGPSGPWLLKSHPTKRNHFPSEELNNELSFTYTSARHSCKKNRLRNPYRLPRCRVPATLKLPDNRCRKHVIIRIIRWRTERG